MDKAAAEYIVGLGVKLNDQQRNQTAALEHLMQIHEMGMTEIAKDPRKIQYLVDRTIELLNGRGDD